MEDFSLGNFRCLSKYSLSHASVLALIKWIVMVRRHSGHIFHVYSDISVMRQTLAYHDDFIL